MKKWLSLILIFVAVNSLRCQCSINYTQSDPLCKGVCTGEVTLIPSGTSPFDITWSIGDTTETVDSLCAGTYNVDMVDDLGCAVTITITISEPADYFIVDAYLASNTSGTGWCDGQIDWSVTGGQPDYTIQWNYCNTSTPYTSLPGFCAGEYYLVMIDDIGCIDTSDCVTVTNNVVSTTEIMEPDEFVVFPNPIQNEINFSGIDSENSEVIIYSTDGKEILRKKIIDENKIDVSELATGSYILKVITESGVYSIQILKE